MNYFFGVSTGAVILSMIEDDPCRLVIYVSAMDVNMKIMAHQVVRREKTVAVPRGPNAVWLPIPPKVAAISALLPCCSSTTTISTAQTITCTMVIKTVIEFPEIPFQLKWCG